MLCLKRKRASCSKSSAVRRGPPRKRVIAVLTNLDAGLAVPVQLVRPLVQKRGRNTEGHGVWRRRHHFVDGIMGSARRAARSGCTGCSLARAVRPVERRFPARWSELAEPTAIEDQESNSGVSTPAATRPAGAGCSRIQRQAFWVVPRGTFDRPRRRKLCKSSANALAVW